MIEKIIKILKHISNNNWKINFPKIIKNTNLILKEYFKKIKHNRNIINMIK